PERGMLAFPERERHAGPVLAPVARPVESPAMAHHPSVPEVDEVDRVSGEIAVLGVVRDQDAPGLATVPGTNDARRTDGPPVSRIDELHVGEPVASRAA